MGLPSSWPPSLFRAGDGDISRDLQGLPDAEPKLTFHLICFCSRVLVFPLFPVSVGQPFKYLGIIMSQAKISCFLKLVLNWFTFWNSLIYAKYLCPQILLVVNLLFLSAPGFSCFPSAIFLQRAGFWGVGQSACFTTVTATSPTALLVVSRIMV